MLSLFTREVPLRVRNVVRREKEIEELCEANDGISYDPESREVMVHVDATGRTFVVRLSEGYPWTGAEGIEVVGVEPKMTDVADEDEDEDELVTWKVRSDTIIYTRPLLTSSESYRIKSSQMASRR